MIAALIAGRIIPTNTVASRPLTPDLAPSAVRYLGPVDPGDEDGFVAPTIDPNAFKLAWIGGSEVKREDTSIPAFFARQVSAVGGKPLAIDTYTLLAMRSVDALSALRAAAASPADAIVMVVNPSWFFPEWGAQEWRALDVAYPGTLWAHPNTWLWAPFIVSPGDLLFAGASAAIPLVDHRGAARQQVDGMFDALDVLAAPAPGSAPTTTSPDGLPPGSVDFWIYHEFGKQALANADVRFSSLLEGLPNGDHAAGDLALQVLLQEASGAGKPVYFYFSPLAFDVLANPTMEPNVAALEARLGSLSAKYAGPNVTVQSTSLTRQMTPRPVFLDVIHMSDPTPLINQLAPRICTQWQQILGAACSPTPKGP